MGVFDNTLGAVLIGIVIAAVLYGFTCIQTWYYYTHYPKDAWHIKFLVGSVLVLDTFHQALITHFGKRVIFDRIYAIYSSIVYTYLVTYYGQIEQLERIVWSLIVEVFFNAFTTLLVQCFLALRVYKLSNKSWLVTGTVSTLIGAGFLTSFVFAVKAIRFETFMQLATLKGLSKAVNVLSAVGDLLIALLLCRMLQVSRTGFRRSDTLINKLIVFSINTGLLTSLCALASLISIVAWPDAFIYITFYFSIGRLYCNTLLATLNARKRLNSASRSADGMSLSFQERSPQQRMSHSTLGSSSKRAPMPNNISVKIDTTEEYIQDEVSGVQGDIPSS